MRILRSSILLLNFLVPTSSILAQPGWVLQNSPVNKSLGRVQFVSSTEGWITSEEGKLLRTTNSGTSWSIVSPAPNDTFELALDLGRDLSFINTTTGWICGTFGSFDNPRGAVFYKTTNGGATWSRQILNQWAYGGGVQFIDANNGWALVATGQLPNINASIIRTTDGGSSWSAGPNFIRRVALFSFVNANNGWAFSDSLSDTGDFIPPSEILRTTDGGATWVRQLRDNTAGVFAGIQFVDVNTGWVVGENAKVLRTTNGGATWNQVAGTGLDASAESRALFFLNTNTGWIGSEASGSRPIVIRTTDGGATWVTQNPPVNRDIAGIFFVDANNGWLTTEGGEIARTIRGGVTSVKQEATLPQSVALFQNYPNPFNPSTTIHYEIPQRSNVEVRVYDAIGRQVATLVNEQEDAGRYDVHWNGADQKGNQVSSGEYFYRLTVSPVGGSGGNTFVETKKLVLVR